METSALATPCGTPIPGPTAAEVGGSQVTCSGGIRCRLEGHWLLVPPFRMQMGRRRYLNRSEIRINLNEIAAGRYRVVAVHNFHVEDRNPDLLECIAAVFLAAERGDGSWEEPERFPVECRTLENLCELTVAPTRGPGGTR